MNLPRPAQAYDMGDQARTRSQIQSWLERARMQGQDLEIAGAERLILSSPNGNRWALGVSNAGATVWTAL